LEINHSQQTVRPTEMSKIKNQKSKISHWLLAVSLLLGGTGAAFAPWIWRESVALQLTGPGLAEFVKFLPEIRTGQLQIQRLYFLLPLFLMILTIPLLAESRPVQLPRWLRWLLRLAVLPLALAALSPVWTPAILVAPEFRLQTGLAGLAVGLALVAPLLKKIPLKILVVALGLGGAAAIVLPWWQFSLIQPSLSNVYQQPVTLGWGWWLTVTGIILTIVASGWIAFKGPSP